MNLNLQVLFLCSRLYQGKSGFRAKRGCMSHDTSLSVYSSRSTPRRTSFVACNSPSHMSLCVWLVTCVCCMCVCVCVFIVLFKVCGCEIVCPFLPNTCIFLRGRFYADLYITIHSFMFCVRCQWQMTHWCIGRTAANTHLQNTRPSDPSVWR